MDETLSCFALATRQPALSGATRNALARKWLALQLGGGDHALYAHIGDDYTLIKRRYQQPVFSNAAFVEMMAAGYRDAPPVHTLSNAHELQAFCDTILPTPVGEELWVPFHDPDGHWRQRAYFLACQLPAVHSDLVSAIYSHGRDEQLCKTRAHRDAASDLYARVNAYHQAHGAASVQAVGKLLQQLDMAHMECEEPVEVVESQGGASDVDAMEEYRREFPVEEELTFVQADAVVSDFFEQRTASMREYAKSALVNATFCNARLAKQMLLLQLGQPIDDLVGRNQLVLKDLPPPLALEPEVLEALAAPLTDLPALDKKSPAVRALYAACGEAPVTPYTFLRTALEVYGGGGHDSDAADQLWKRQLLKRFPQVDASITACFAAL